MMTVIDTNAPALSDGAERFLSTLREHGMHNECTAAARRAPLTVRVRWSTATDSGELDCIAFSTLDAVKQTVTRMPGARVMASVIRRGAV